VPVDREKRTRILISALIGAASTIPAVSILAMEKYPHLYDFLDRFPEWMNSGIQVALGILMIPGLMLGSMVGRGVHTPSIAGMIVGSFVFYCCAAYYGLKLRARWKATAPPQGDSGNQGRPSSRP
jgi:hypothetical protein